MRLTAGAPPAPVLGLYTNPTMNALYRIITPMRAIGGSWANIAAVSEAQLDAAETVVIHALGGRVGDVRACIRDLRRRWGVKTILVDYDDAVFHPHPVKAVRMRAFQVASVREATRLADGVIVTNEYNRAHFAQHTDRPIGVVPNLIIPEDWPEVAPPADPGPPVVVLAGSPSHHLDWDTIVPALAQMRKQIPDVPLRLLGYGHPLLRQIATQGGGGWMSPPVYQQALAGGAIGLCPLPDTPFNRGKSPVKALEYSLAAGMAVIGSPTQYADLLGTERGTVVADGSPFGWQLALGTLLANPDARREQAARLRSHILRAFDARSHRDALTSVYTTQEGLLCPSSSLAPLALSRSGQPTT